MCYILYGALRGNIDAEEYKSIEDKYEIKHIDPKAYVTVSDVADVFRGLE
ncbi:MAG: hypothetical protein IJ331_07050 [Ruminococcus sp.]|nr:hypothetical protein [Ruminococcus sp.]